MRVVIEASVFQGAAGELELCALLRLGFAERHRVLIDPLYASADPDDNHPLQAWLDRLPAILREECDLALQISLDTESRSPSTTGIRIAPVSTPDWSQPAEPILPLTQAMRLLERPFRVLVENGHNDKGFFLTVAEEGDRQFLEMMVDRGWLVFEHTGGTGHMLNRVREIAAHPGSARSAWVLFDSDRLQPTQASPAIERLREACGTVVPFHQLERRYIENYLPVEALTLWANRRVDRQKIVAAFKGLSRQQRDYYNMKRGFNGDRGRRDLNAGALYENLRPVRRRQLATGFGERVAETLFHRPDCRQPSWYINDGQQSETHAMIKDLLALL